MPRPRKSVEEPQKRGRKPVDHSKHADQYKQLGLTISYYRKLKGLTQQELGEIAGCRQTHISNLESPNAKTSISIEMLLDIADALGVPVNKLFETR